MPHRPCRWAGCPAVVELGRRYCPAHEARGQQHEAERTKGNRHHSTPEQKRVYNSAQWASLRQQVLQEQPICGVCGREWSIDVDHITPLADAPARAYERANLQGLCRRCHATKTRAEQRGRRAAGG